MKESAESHHNDPPFDPYMVVEMDKSPWGPPQLITCAPIAAWIAQSAQDKRATTPKEVSAHPFILYRVPFTPAAVPCHVFDPIRGHSVQFSRFRRLEISQSHFLTVEKLTWRYEGNRADVQMCRIDVLRFSANKSMRESNNLSANTPSLHPLILKTRTS